MLPVLYSYIIMGYTLSARVSKSISYFYERLKLSYEVFNNPRIFVFYKGYLQPVPYNNRNNEASQLFYDVDKSLFYPSNTFGGKLQSIPILSLEIRDMSNNLIYDLTNFIESMQFIQTEMGAKPSFASIIMIWATLNHMYFNPMNHKLQYIDGLGDTHDASFTDTESLTII
jgi:hypothetical protein